MAKRKRQAGPSASRRGKTRKVSGKRPTKRPVSKKAKKSSKAAGKKPVSRARPNTAKTRARKKTRASAPAPQVETEIVDVVEEAPGLVTITELETTRVIIPDSDEEDEK